MEGREPIFKAPWPAVVLVVMLPALYAGQSYLAARGYPIGDWALVPQLLFGQHRWLTLITSTFLHAGWWHVIMNDIAALAFAPPIVRLFGLSFRGVLAFVAFYLLCGVLAGLGFALISPDSTIPVVGASGAISGLFGAAIRLLNPERRLAPLLTPYVFSASAAWIVVNIVMGFGNLMPGLQDGMTVAWQAHVIGYLSGLLLIGPWAFLLAPKAPASDQAASEFD